MARVSRWLFTKSKSLHLQPFVSPLPTLSTVPAGLDYRKLNRGFGKKKTAAKDEWTEKQYRNIEMGSHVRKQQGGLQHPQGSHQDLTA